MFVCVDNDHLIQIQLFIMPKHEVVFIDIDSVFLCTLRPKSPYSRPYQAKMDGDWFISTQLSILTKIIWKIEKGFLRKYLFGI